jgi:quinol monooxygenase YgiN
MFCRRLLLAVPILALAISDARAQDENPIVTLAKSKVKDKTKPFNMTVTFKVRAGQEKEFEVACKPCLVATRKESGCLGYFLNHDVDDSTVFVVYEQFKNIAALEEHAKSKHVEELLKKISPLLESAPTAKIYIPAGEEKIAALSK